MPIRALGHRLQTTKCSLYVAMFTVMLAGCSGGSGSAEIEQAASADIALVSSTRTLAATVIVEERSGKTVLDAWFSERETVQPNNAIAAISAFGDRCTAQAASSGRGSIPTTARVSTQVNIASRAETVATLERFESDSVSSYTTAVRWLDEPIPVDAILSFDQPEVLPNLGTIALPELAPLQWTAPNSGLLNSVQQSLQWVPSQTGDTRIHLNFSRVGESGSEYTAVVVQCDVADDGEFALDKVTRQALGGAEAEVVFRAQRVRMRVLSSGDESATIIQISHASI